MKRWLAFGGAAIGLLDDALYLHLIDQQGNRSILSSVVVIVSTAIAAALLLALAATVLLKGTTRRAALLVAGVMLTILGVLGIFSIGLPLLVAAALLFASR